MKSHKSHDFVRPDLGTFSAPAGGFSFEALLGMEVGSMAGAGGGSRHSMNDMTQQWKSA